MRQTKVLAASYKSCRITSSVRHWDELWLVLQTPSGPQKEKVEQAPKAKLKRAPNMTTTAIAERQWEFLASNDS